MGILLVLSLLTTCVDVDALAADPRSRVELRFATNVAVADDLAVLDRVVAEAGPGGICVVGATDDVGGDDDNLALGAARAAFVVEALVQRGVEPARLSSMSVGEHRLGRAVVVVFDARPPVVVEPEVVDVLDLRIVPRTADDDDEDEEETTTVSRPKPKAARTPHFTDALAPEWRRPAGALVVAVGGACGASVGLGLCCVAPFTAPIGVTVAAGAVDEVAEQDAMSGAGVGAILGTVGGVLLGLGLGFGVATLVEGDDDNRALSTTLALSSVAAGSVAGAGVGAAVGWWGSPSGRAMATSP